MALARQGHGLVLGRAHDREHPRGLRRRGAVQALEEGGRQDEEGAALALQLSAPRRDGKVHRKSTTMTGWALKPKGRRTGGAWRPGAAAKIKAWIKEAEAAEDAAATTTAADGDAEMDDGGEGAVPAVVPSSPSPASRAELLLLPLVVLTLHMRVWWASPTNPAVLTAPP